MSLELHKDLGRWPMFKDPIINMHMVYEGFRTACLIEPANYADENMTDLLTATLEIINKLKLSYNTDDIGRILITKLPVDASILEDDSLLGELLGFHCWDHSSFGRSDLDRVSASIKLDMVSGEKISLYAEVCEMVKLFKPLLVKHITQLVEKYQKLIGEEYGMVTYSIEEDHGTKHRYRMAQAANFGYIDKHIEDYANDFDNAANNMLSAALMRNGTYKQYYPLLFFMYKNLVIDDSLIILYPPYDGTNKQEIIEKEKEIVAFEKSMYDLYDSNPVIAERFFRFKTAENAPMSGMRELQSLNVDVDNIDNIINEKANLLRPR